MSQQRMIAARLPLAPSEVRARILEEHRRLRKRLFQVQELARATALDDVHAPELRTTARALIMEFGLHLESEEEILLPVVADITGSGPELAAHMQQEHAEQRAELREMFQRTETRAEHQVLAQEMDQFVLRILKDMRSEEQAVLREDLLRDDVIAIDQCCG
jgi:hypothetical protein